MQVIVNDMEVLGDPPTEDQIRNEPPENLKPPGPTPRDIYWATRKLIERRVRLHAR